MTHFHITRADIAALLALLREIPRLVEDLAITLTRQDQTSSQTRTSGGSDEQPLPYNIAASDTHDLLDETLTAWAALVYTTQFTPRDFIGPLRSHERRQPQPPGNSTLALTRWLIDHITYLATTPGAEDAYDEIAYAMGQCRCACDRPTDTAVLPTDPAKIHALEALELTAKECVTTARTAGIPILKRRIDYLGETRPSLRIGKTDRGEWIYRLGDVLSANGTPLTADLHREAYVLG